MYRRKSDREQNLSFNEMQTEHNSRRILLVGTLYTALEIVGLILSTLGFFESDIRLPVLIIVIIHLIYLPLLLLSYKGYILKNSDIRFVYVLSYVPMILGWGILLTSYTSLGAGDITVFSMAVLMVCALILLKPVLMAAFLLLAFFFMAYFILLPANATPDPNALIFRSLILCALGWGLSRGNYINRSLLFESEAKLLKINSTLKDQTLRDSMTGLFNNAYIYDFLTRSLIMESGRQNTLAVMMIDLDHFKKINDSFGHAVGDEVLLATSKCMLSCTRDTDMVGRYGGEEFIVILGETTPDKAFLIAERIRRSIEKINHKEGFSVSCSIGLAMSGGQSSEELIHEADARMYEAKRQGRNRVSGPLNPF